MKLTDDPKKQTEEAAGKEQARSINEEAVTLLTDDEMEMVSGGGCRPGGSPTKLPDRPGYKNYKIG